MKRAVQACFSAIMITLFIAAGVNACARTGDSPPGGEGLPPGCDYVPNGRGFDLVGC